MVVLELVTFSATKFKKEKKKKKLLRKCKPGYILNIKMAFDLFNDFSLSFIPSRVFLNNRLKMWI